MTNWRHKIHNNKQERTIMKEIKNKEGVVVINRIHKDTKSQSELSYYNYYTSKNKVYDSFKIEPKPSDCAPFFSRNIFCHHFVGQKI